MKGSGKSEHFQNRPSVQFKGLTFKGLIFEAKINRGRLSWDLEEIKIFEKHLLPGIEAFDIKCNRFLLI